MKKPIGPKRPRTIPGQPTPRELQVIKLLAQGKRITEIAHALFIDYRTVSGYVERLHAKLEVNSHIGIVFVAARRGWITLDLATMIPQDSRLLANLSVAEFRDVIRDELRRASATQDIGN